MTAYTGWKNSLAAGLSEVGRRFNRIRVNRVTLTGDLDYQIPGGANDFVHSVVFTQDAAGGHAVTFAGNPVPVDTAADSDTTIEFVPSSSGYVVRPLMPAGTYARADSTPANVKDFGAVGDGVTDDRAAFVAAIAASSDIIVPPGTYRLSAPVTIDKDLTIVGVGRTTSRWAPASGGSIIKPDGDSYAFESAWTHVTSATNLIFVGNGIKGACSGTIRGCEFRNGSVGILNAKVVRVEDCSFHDMTTAGIQTITDCHVSGSYFYNNAVGIHLLNSNSNWITHNKIEWNTNHGILGDTHSFNLVEGNLIDRNGVGLETLNGTGLSVIANKFERNMTRHMILRGSVFQIASNAFTKRNSEDDNTGTNVPTGGAIHVVSLSNAAFTANVVSGDKMFVDGYEYTSNLTFATNTISGVSEQVWRTLPAITIPASGEATSTLDAASLNFFDNNPLSCMIENHYFTGSGSNVYTEGSTSLRVVSIQLTPTGVLFTVQNVGASQVEITPRVQLTHSIFGKR